MSLSICHRLVTLLHLLTCFLPNTQMTFVAKSKGFSVLIYLRHSLVLPEHLHNRLTPTVPCSFSLPSVLCLPNTLPSLPFSMALPWCFLSSLPSFWGDSMCNYGLPLPLMTLTQIPPEFQLPLASSAQFHSDILQTLHLSRFNIKLRSCSLWPAFFLRSLLVIDTPTILPSYLPKSWFCHHFSIMQRKSTIRLTCVSYRIPSISSLAVLVWEVLPPLFFLMMLKQPFD